MVSGADTVLNGEKLCDWLPGLESSHMLLAVFSGVFLKSWKEYTRSSDGSSGQDPVLFTSSSLGETWV